MKYVYSHKISGVLVAALFLVVLVLAWRLFCLLVWREAMVVWWGVVVRAEARGTGRTWGLELWRARRWGSPGPPQLITHSSIVSKLFSFPEMWTHQIFVIAWINFQVIYCNKVDMVQIVNNFRVSFNFA